MYEELGSVREPVALSPREVLDSAQRLVVELGYEIAQRTDTSLTAVRRERAGTFKYSTLNLTVVARSRAEGGVQVKLRGTDKEGVQERQAEWARWAESLPKVSAAQQEHGRAAQGAAEPETTVTTAEEPTAEGPTAELREIPESGMGFSGGDQSEDPVVGDAREPEAQAETTANEEKQSPAAGSGRWASVTSWDEKPQVASSKQEEPTIPPAKPSGADANAIGDEQARRGNRTAQSSDSIRERIAKLREELEKAQEAEGENETLAEERATIHQQDASAIRQQASGPTESEETLFAKAIETESLRIVDKQRQVRGLFSASDNDSSRLALFDGSGNVGAMLTVDDDSATLALVDEAGQPRVRLAVGSSDRPALDLVDSRGQLRMRITLEDEGSPALTLVDSSGTPRATFKEDSGRFLIGFVDADEETRGTFFIDRDGSPKLILKDALGAIRCILVSDVDGAPTVGLFHEGEEVRASLSIGDDGLPSLLLVDNNHNLRAALRIQDDGSPSLTLIDKWGNPRRV